MHLEHFVPNASLEFFSLYMLLYWGSIIVSYCILAMVSNNTKLGMGMIRRTKSYKEQK